MNYGKAIRVARAARGISQVELAHRTGLNNKYLSSIEAGRRAPSGDALSSLAKALDVPVYLLALMGSDPEDLRGVPAEQAAELAHDLLQVVVGRELERQK